MPIARSVQMHADRPPATDRHPDLTEDAPTIAGIYDVAPERITQLAQRGGAVRLVGSARRDDAGDVRIEIAPRDLESGDPLIGVPGFAKTITYMSDTMGRLTLVGGPSVPHAAGAALLRDVLLLLRVGARL